MHSLHHNNPMVLVLGLIFVHTPSYQATHLGRIALVVPRRDHTNYTLKAGSYCN